MPSTPSPLRYPGGKTKLYGLIQPIVAANIVGANRIYVEPFAGGSGLALKLLFNHDVDQLILNDIDYRIYCFWQACLHDTNQLCTLVQNCDVTVDNWRIQKDIYMSPDSYTQTQVGFATFFLNRCNVSGVISGGPIGGFDQLGTYLIDARFNRNALIARIRDIGAQANNITFYNLDASTFLQNELPQVNIDSIFLNIDPPYVKKGKLLYENSFHENDHTELSRVVQALQYKWIVTYDECDLIQQLYSDRRQQVITLDYSAGSTRKGSEFLILSDLIVIPEQQ
ncbi:DNA adenine methylase [Anaerotruncus rubiinfantis]|uniref:DNA adenine methylase n=1 Tax=Anaerotruncus rubiinfantis TaxID=1720200 RepID=UPI0034A37F20